MYVLLHAYRAHRSPIHRASGGTQKPPPQGPSPGSTTGPSAPWPGAWCLSAAHVAPVGQPAQAETEGAGLTAQKRGADQQHGRNPRWLRRATGAVSSQPEPAATGTGQARCGEGGFRSWSRRHTRGNRPHGSWSRLRACHAGPHARPSPGQLLRPAAGRTAGRSTPEKFGDGLRPGAYLEFFVDPADVGVDGLVGDAEFLGDFLVEEALGQEIQDLVFPR